jgi:hypothetical protein
MLALDDSAFARLCIAATGVHRGRRRRWLRKIAAKLDPPRAVIRSRERSCRKRERRRNGTRCYTLELPDNAVAAMINAMVATERLTEAEASNHARVQAELGRMLCDWAQHWSG